LYKYARWFFVALTVAGLVPACSSSENDPAESSGLVCGQLQQCVYDEQDEQVCHQSCSDAAGPPCPSGQVCSQGTACCGNDPAYTCSGPLAFVCCPPSGC
jgi:hypothetical protein